MITILLCILTGIAAIGAVGAERLSQFRYTPLTDVLLTLGFEKAFLVVAIVALTATASVLLIQMFSISRAAYAMSINKQLPSFLFKIHPKFKTPYRAEITVGSIMAVAALYVEMKSLITLTSFGILSYYSLINLAAF